MEEFNEWFSETLGYIYHQQLWISDESELLPLWLDGWPYLVFGAPDEVNLAPVPRTHQTQPSDADTPIKISLIGGTPVCMEHASAADLHPWPAPWTSGETTLSSHRQFIRPATVKDVAQYKSQTYLKRRDRLKPSKLRFRWTLSTSNKSLAQQFVTKVASADLSCGPWGRPIVTLQAKPADYGDLKGLYLILNTEVLGEETGASANMVAASYGVPGDDGLRSYEVDRTFDKLIRVVGKNKVMKALCGQWIGEEREVADIIFSALGATADHS